MTLALRSCMTGSHRKGRASSRQGYSKWVEITPLSDHPGNTIDVPGSGLAFQGQLLEVRKGMDTQRAGFGAGYI